MDSQPQVLAFPTKGKSQPEWILSESKVAEYRATHPALDVPAELRKAWHWAMDNPSKRKTHAGMPRFLSAWLGKAAKDVRATAAGNGKHGATPEPLRPLTSDEIDRLNRGETL